MRADRKIVNRAELIQRVQIARRNGQRVVFTNGCFDIVHAGHIDLLEKAKSCGDILIVALNSDSSIRKIKGPDRPIVNETDRARLIAAIETVDFVTFFNEETPIEILREIQPDVIVKGSDYRKEEIVGYDFIPEVKVIPLVPEQSTSKIIEKIRRIST
ncbi:MAG TPA: D-glycero-beta-D-manno-heptose 1-phosphate adenylyltransferase [Candidatus Marinimicrobia bacterium]|nr:D-glycero-beta-D-manno-heptose 1-phosphate adenylyltransferase [Candidatus Neomarinimicrobiota bacterium]